MKIILIHGQSRSPLAMALLAWRLRRYQVHQFGYACFYESWERIVTRFVALVRRTASDAPYIIVGHSLGCIITRASLPQLVDCMPQHIVMLAPPNQPPRLAKRARHRLVYRLITRDCGHTLTDARFYQTLPRPTIPTTIIAGTRGLYGRFSPFGDVLNDSVLTVEETKFDGGTEVVLLPVTHSFLMNSRAVAEVILTIAQNACKNTGPLLH